MWADTKQWFALLIVQEMQALVGGFVVEWLVLGPLRVAKLLITDGNVHNLRRHMQMRPIPGLARHNLRCSRVLLPSRLPYTCLPFPHFPMEARLGLTDLAAPDNKQCMNFSHRQNPRQSYIFSFECSRGFQYCSGKFRMFRLRERAAVCGHDEAIK